MDFSFVASFAKRKKSDLLVLPFFQEEKPEPAADSGNVVELAKLAVATGDFKGKESEVLILYSEAVPDTRVALLGLGKKADLSVETLRRSYSALLSAALCRKVSSINLVVPETSLEGAVVGIAEGLLLSNYAFEELKSKSKDEEKTQLVKHCAFIGADSSSSKRVKRAGVIAEGVYLTRDLINGNADDINPQALAKIALDMAKDLPAIKATVFDKKRIEKEKMGLLLAVNRGSPREPAFIILEYKGNPKSDDHTVLVGKGITYDTGGLNLKPTGSMETMKCDMSGAAIVLGTLQATARLGLKKNITVVIPSTENCIGGNSYKPGDVYVAYSGKTVEIGNTDAEGRLVLADALAYAVKKLKPTRIIDFATLTGAIVIALGEETTGMMSNNDQLAEALASAGQSTYERIWRLPIFEEYKKQLKSDVADLKNTGGRSAGSITAAIFLQQFVDKTPWAHFDVAGTAFLSKARFYHPKNGSGIGVRLMLEFLDKGVP
jgi:leucyl aminopeptidase